jgi:hypothetical protein
MRQVHQEIANNQQVAAEMQATVNDASAQLVLTDAALKRKWEAEQDDEERERLNNEFFHVRSILRTMTEDRGRAGAHIFAAEQALDADQQEHPENPSAALAAEYAECSASYDLRTSMIDDFVPGKQAGEATAAQETRQESPLSSGKGSSESSKASGDIGRSRSNGGRRNVRVPRGPRGALPRDTAARRRLFRT